MKQQDKRSILPVEPKLNTRSLHMNEITFKGGFYENSDQINDRSEAVVIVITFVNKACDKELTTFVTRERDCQGYLENGLELPIDVEEAAYDLDIDPNDLEICMDALYTIEFAKIANELCTSSDQLKKVITSEEFNNFCCSVTETD